MADVLFVEYPKCSTCQKAKAWLDEHGITYDDRDIVADNPTANELRTWHERSGLPLRRFFNTSGMLVKRPLLVTASTVIPGFKEATWEEALGL